MIHREIFEPLFEDIAGISEISLTEMRGRWARDGSLEIYAKNPFGEAVLDWFTKDVSKQNRLDTIQRTVQNSLTP